MGESRTGAPGAEGVIIRGTCRGGLGAASFQDFPCESGTQKPSECLERWVCFSLDTEMAPQTGPGEAFSGSSGSISSPCPGSRAADPSCWRVKQSITLTLGGGGSVQGVILSPCPQSCPAHCSAAGKELCPQACSCPQKPLVLCHSLHPPPSVSAEPAAPQVHYHDLLRSCFPRQRRTIPAGCWEL